MRQHLPSFSGVRVLDLSDRWGQFAGKLLAELGADVVLAEPQHGHELRRAWPMAVARDGEPISLYFWHFNIGKRSLLWQLDTDEGRQEATRLLDAADVVLVGAQSHQRLLEHVPDALRRAATVCITAYGVGHPDARRDDDLHVSAQSGMALLSGYGDDDSSEPMMPPVEQAMHCAGLYAAVASLTALSVRKPGDGCFFDVSAQAAAFQSTEQLFGHWVYRQEHLHRRGGGYATPVPSPRWEVAAADGNYVYAYGMLPLTDKGWKEVRAWMREEGRIEDLDDPEFDELKNFTSPYPLPPPERGRHATSVIQRFIESMPAEKVYREGQKRKLTWGRMYQPHDALGEEQFRHRQFFYETAWPGDDAVHLTQSMPWVLTGDAVSEPPDPVTRPPRVGEHTIEVRSEWVGDDASPGRSAT